MKQDSYIAKIVNRMLALKIILVELIISATLLVFCYSALAQSDDFVYLPVRHVTDISGGFDRPTEVAVSNDGKIYVLDGANNRIVIFRGNGEQLFSFGKDGKLPGEFHNPVGMEIDNKENIYVADTGNQRIQIFDSAGKYIRLIDLAPMKARPVEVKLSPLYEKIYVSDAHNHQILCFKKDGSFESSWGKYGEMPGEFMYPGMADIDSKGNIHIVDILNGRVQIFTPAGKNTGQLGKFGVTPGKFFRPKGIVIDQFSRIYVSDSYTGVIQLFEGSGKLIGILSEDNVSPLRLTTPLGIALNPEKNYFYVVQSNLNLVSVFELMDNK